MSGRTMVMTVNDWSVEKRDNVWCKDGKKVLTFSFTLRKRQSEHLIEAADDSPASMLTLLHAHQNRTI